MKAFGINEYGDISQIKEIEIPVPKLENPFDILVNVKAVSVNPVDAKVRKGSKGGSISGDARILGYDAAGIVVEVGKEAEKWFKNGDAVYYAGSLIRPGSNAEYQLVDARIVGKKPESLTWGEAAALPLVALTAMEGLYESLQFPIALKRAESGAPKSILVIGAAGGVGSLAIQLAKKISNLIVIGTSSRPESTEYLKTLGADHIISHKAPLAPQLEQIGIPKVNYVFNTQSTDEYFDQITGILAYFGGVVLINTAEKSHNIGALMGVRGQLAYEFMFARPISGVDLHLQGEHLNHLTRLLEQKVISLPKIKTIPLTLENLKETHSQIESQTTIGKITLAF
jgi:NADPH2:quinone reductase